MRFNTHRFIEQQDLVKNNWSLSKKLTLRFFIIFFVLHAFPFMIEFYFPFLSKAFDWYTNIYTKIIPWFGEKVLHAAFINPADNYDGDTLFGYTKILFLFIVATIGSLIWTLLDQTPRKYNRLLYWFTVGVRYYLAFVIFVYGFGKIIQTQFPYPNLFKLNQTFGTQSPMGLLWNFMGFSKSYNFFTGMAEVVGALLILFRRTLTLGALILVTVLSNVVMLNFCYDVSVKLYSSLELMMAMFLAGLDYKRLLNVFFKNKIALPVYELKPFATQRYFFTSRIVKWTLIVFVLLFSYKENANYFVPAVEIQKKQPLRGIYEVELFMLNKDTLAPLTTDTTRWRKVIIEYPDRGQIQLMNDSTSAYSILSDSAAQSLVLMPRSDTLQKNHFSFFKQQPNQLILKGNWKTDSLIVTLKKLDENQYLLNSRGFHWVNETLHR